MTTTSPGFILNVHPLILPLRVYSSAGGPLPPKEVSMFGNYKISAGPALIPGNSGKGVTVLGAHRCTILFTHSSQGAVQGNEKGDVYVLVISKQIAAALADTIEEIIKESIVSGSGEDVFAFIQHGASSIQFTADNSWSDLKSFNLNVRMERVSAEERAVWDNAVRDAVTGAVPGVNTRTQLPFPFIIGNYSLNPLAVRVFQRQDPASPLIIRSRDIDDSVGEFFGIVGTMLDHDSSGALMPNQDGARTDMIPRWYRDFPTPDLTTQTLRDDLIPALKLSPTFSIVDNRTTMMVLRRHFPDLDNTALSILSAELYDAILQDALAQRR